MPNENPGGTGGNLPNTAGEDIVFDNLGLSRSELGLDQDTGSGNEDLDAGSGNDDLGSGQDDQGSGQDGRVSQTPPRPIPSYAEVHADHKGNLVNEYGQVVARSGKEARLYQDLHKTKGQAQTLQGQVNEVNGRLKKAVEIGQGLHRENESLKAQMNAVKQFGLDQSEHLTALRLFKELRDNPRDAIKNILTRAATNGINVAELGLQGGIDSKSLVEMIKQEIGNAVGPLKERTEAERQAAQRQQQLEARKTEVMNEVNSFFGSNPDAQPYLHVFQETLKQFPGMSLGECWARIQLELTKNPQTRRQPQNSRQRSLPSGRGAPASGNGSSDLAPVTDSYDAILKDVMDRAGLTR